MKLGIDLMGSDNSPHELLPALIQAKSFWGKEHQFLVFCTQEYQDKVPFKAFVCPEVISMDENPLLAVRQKKNSTLVEGIKALRDGHIDAFLSAGNTGALIAASTLFLKLQPGCRRPALMVSLPSVKDPLAILDVGGMVAPTEEDLLSYARIGAEYQRKNLKKSKPKVGLLNIGQESQKGSAFSRSVYLKLASCGQDFEFVGNIEARDLFSGKIDVLVTDGFAGNVLIKAVEGTSQFIFDYLEAIGESDLAKIRPHFSYEHNPGAFVAGIEGIVVKCHGAATAKSLLSGIEGVFRLG